MTPVSHEVVLLKQQRGTEVIAVIWHSGRTDSGLLSNSFFGLLQQ